ncbi:MAG: polysaccharide biosynthesis protein [Oscillospiraceae bacterium]|nr:polysaccharide biosynthesis protein [Oscillospiraceae bacterium]
MPDSRSQNYLKGAAILAAASILAKVISVVYKIPLFQIMDAAGRGTFQVTYNVFALILAISTAGIPAALSRMVSSANASDNNKLARRYFSVALPAFIIIGAVAMLVMFFFADYFAMQMNNSLAAPGIRVLSPAVFFACIIAVYRGYAQGHGNMIPTAISQIVEVICKAIIGIAAALWLVHLGYGTGIVSAGAITGVTIGLGISVPLLVWYKQKLDRNISNSDHCTTESQTPLNIFGRIMKVSLPITLSAATMSTMVVIDSAIVLGRLQSVLGYTEIQASELFGIYALGLPVYNLPPAIVVPVSMSIIPAIAAAIARGRTEEAGVIMQSSLKLANLIAMPASAGLMILATPILMALYGYDIPLATAILTVLGAASFFSCLQYITTAILQANGHERVALVTVPIGAIIKILTAYFLSGNPNIGILASPIGTLACFVVISALNICFIIAKIKEKPKFNKAFIRPLLCTIFMAMATYLAYTGLLRFGSEIMGTGRYAVTAFLILSIIVGISVYGILIIVTRTITMEDMKLVPKGAKLARLLRIRS